MWYVDNKVTGHLRVPILKDKQREFVPMIEFFHLGDSVAIYKA